MPGSVGHCVLHVEEPLGRIARNQEEAVTVARLQRPEFHRWAHGLTAAHQLHRQGYGVDLSAHPLAHCHALEEHGLTTGHLHCGVDTKRIEVVESDRCSNGGKIVGLVVQHLELEIIALRNGKYSHELAGQGLEGDRARQAVQLDIAANFGATPYRNIGRGARAGGPVV